MNKRRSLAPRIESAVEQLEDRQLLSATSVEQLMQCMRASDFDAMVRAVAAAAEIRELSDNETHVLEFRALGQGRHAHTETLTDAVAGKVQMHTDAREGLRMSGGALRGGRRGQEALTVTFEQPQRIYTVDIEHLRGRKGGLLTLSFQGRTTSFALGKDDTIDTGGAEADSITLSAPPGGAYSLGSIRLQPSHTVVEEEVVEEEEEEVVEEEEVAEEEDVVEEEEEEVVEEEEEEVVEEEVEEEEDVVEEEEEVVEEEEEEVVEEEVEEEEDVVEEEEEEEDVVEEEEVTEEENVQTEVEPEEEPENDDMTQEALESLNAQITSAVTAALQEEAERIGSPKMEVSVVGYAYGYTDIAVKFRSPHEQSHLVLVVDGGGQNNPNQSITRTHSGGTQEDTWNIRLRGHTNAPGGIVTISLYDKPGGALLQRAFAYYKAHGNQYTALTRFGDWNEDNEEDPALAPALHVTTQGSVAFVRYRVPSSSAYVQIVNPGLYEKKWDAVSIMAEDGMNHDGGTANGFLQVALPAGLKTDKALELRLWDKQWGRHFATVPLWWNGSYLQVMSEQEPWEGMRHAEETLATSIQVPTQQIENIQSQVLAGKTMFVVSGAEMERRLRAKYPDIFMGEHEYVLKKRAENPNFSDGHYIDQYRDITNDMLLRYRWELEEYDKKIIHFIKSGMEWWVKAKWGTYDAEHYASLKNEVEAKSFPLSDLFPRPTFSQVMSECKRLLNEEDKYLERVQVDDDMYREGADYRAKQQVYTDYGSPPTRSVSRRMQTLERKIGEALASSNDPRIVAYRKTVSDGLVRHWAEDTFLVAQANYGTDAEVGGVSVEEVVQEQLSSLEDINQLRQSLAQADRKALFREAIGWHTDEAITLPNSFSVAPNTAAGKIFLGLYQHAFQLERESAMTRFVQAEMILGVNAHQLWLASQGKDSERFFQVMLNEWHTAGQYHIFAQHASAAGLGNDNIRAETNKNLYENGHIRIHWDLANMDLSQVSHAGVYLVNGQDTDHQLHLKWLSGEIKGSMYTEVPVEKIGKLDFPSFRIKVVVWMNDGSTVHTFTDVFEVRWDGTQILDTETDNESTGILATNNDLSALPDIPEYQERIAVENALLKYLHVPVKAEGGVQWKYTLGSTAHDNEDHGRESQFYNIDMNWGSFNDDQGKDVFSASSGVVVSTPDDSGSKYGTVLIEHTSEVMINGSMQVISWYSKYLHMDNIQVKKGDTVTIDTHIGDVSDIHDLRENGEKINMSSHLHFETYFVLSEITYRIDLKNWLVEHNIEQQ